MIYSYQLDVYKALRRTAAAHILSQKASLPIKPRFHRLIVGPTGTGKTHLANELGQSLNWSVFHASVSNWIVMGAKETPTMHVIVDWLANDNRPHLLVLDELDKISGDDSWTRNARVELFSLLDGRFPFSGTFSGTEADGTDGENPTEKRRKAEANLKKVLCIGCGAFQHLFDARPAMGFSEPKGEKKRPAHLARSLQREMVNRFDSDLLVLPALGARDYEEMVAEIAPHLPPDAAEIIGRIAKGRIDDAVESQSGARFIENLLSAAIYEVTAGDQVTPHVEPLRPKAYKEDTSMPAQEQIDAATEDTMWDEPVPHDA